MCASKLSEKAADDFREEGGEGNETQHRRSQYRPGRPRLSQCQVDLLEVIYNMTTAPPWLSTSRLSRVVKGPELCIAARNSVGLILEWFCRRYGPTGRNATRYTKAASTLIFWDPTDYVLMFMSIS